MNSNLDSSTVAIIEARKKFNLFDLNLGEIDIYQQLQFQITKYLFKTSTKYKVTCFPEPQLSDLVKTIPFGGKVSNVGIALKIDDNGFVSEIVLPTHTYPLVNTCNKNDDIKEYTSKLMNDLKLVKMPDYGYYAVTKLNNDYQELIKGKIDKINVFSMSCDLPSSNTTMPIKDSEKNCEKKIIIAKDCKGEVHKSFEDNAVSSVYDTAKILFRYSVELVSCKYVGISTGSKAFTVAAVGVADFAVSELTHYLSPFIDGYEVPVAVAVGVGSISGIGFFAGSTAAYATLGMCLSNVGGKSAMKSLPIKYNHDLEVSHASMLSNTVVNVLVETVMNFAGFSGFGRAIPNVPKTLANIKAGGDDLLHSVSQHARAGVHTGDFKIIKLFFPTLGFDYYGIKFGLVSSVENVIIDVMNDKFFPGENSSFYDDTI